MAAMVRLSSFSIARGIQSLFYLDVLLIKMLELFRLRIAAAVRLRAQNGQPQSTSVERITVACRSLRGDGRFEPAFSEVPALDSARSMGNRDSSSSRV